jgi:hypothetical protein
MLTSFIYDYSAIIIVIVFCSFIQSLFGVGILLFGTPTFLFMGFSFEESLEFTLPASLSISLFQIYTNYELLRDRKESILITLPTLLTGLIFLLTIDQSSAIQLCIGLILIVVAVMRTFSNIKENINFLIKKYQKVTLAIIGFIHGFTNLGGGLLTFYAASKHSNKKVITSNIAFIYAVFAFTQMVFLFFFSNFSFALISLLLPIISASIFIFSGKYLIEKINNNNYIKVITLIIFIYGLLSLISFFNS